MEYLQPGYIPPEYQATLNAEIAKWHSEHPSPDLFDGSPMPTWRDLLFEPLRLLARGIVNWSKKLELERPIINVEYSQKTEEESGRG